MPKFGLIGKKLSHSFSKDYFSKKFKKIGINSTYELFELNSIKEFKKLKTTPNLKGLNVTVPYKQSIIPFLDELDSISKDIGAVNTIKFIGGKIIGYNSDYFGFRESLENFVIHKSQIKAIVLGNGGASKAVQKVLKDLNINFVLVTRTKINNELNYNDLSDEIIRNSHLIINTTTLGMSPEVQNYPNINYSCITNEHYCFDLIYNPNETLFLLKCKEKGANILNGLEMLKLQAEKSWKIWNT